MASEIQVQTISGPPTGANANKVIIPAGQTLDASAGSVTLPAGAGGKLVQVVRGNNVGTGQLTVPTSYTEVSSNYRTTITVVTTNPYIKVTWVANPEIDGANDRTAMRFYMSKNGGAFSAWSGPMWLGPLEDVGSLQGGAPSIVGFYQTTAAIGDQLTFTPYHICESGAGMQLEYGQNFAFAGGVIDSYMFIEEIAS